MENGMREGGTRPKQQTLNDVIMMSEFVNLKKEIKSFVF